MTEKGIGLNTRSTLTQADLNMFACLGIDAELLSSAGIFRVTDQEARTFGFQFSSASRLDGLVFPYFNPLTDYRVTSRLRRDHPDVELDGKPKNKYIFARGDNPHLYFPPGCTSLLSDPAVPVVFVESEKGSLAITAMMGRAGRRFLSVATGGCWSWLGKVGIKTTACGSREVERGPLSDLSLIALEEGRPALIVFDSNVPSNLRVRSARWALAQMLVGLGATVQFVNVPGEGGINGPDDLIGAAGDEAMLKLIDTAKPFPEQAEQAAQAAVKALSNSCTLETRDEALDAIARLPDFSHQRVFVERAAKALGEKSKKSIELEIGSRVKTLREDCKQANEAVRQARLLRVKVDPAALIRDLEAFFSKRLGLPNGAALILALFTLNTYLFDVFDTTPYLQIDSALGGCGKTTLLHHLEATCCRAYLGCDPTEATLYRRIDRDRPTWLLDEAAVLRGHEERARMIRAVLHAGYRKGATVSRCEGEINELRDFGVYSPKAFALVGSLRGTLLDRCIVLHLQKTAGLPKTKLKRLCRDASPLREKLAAYAAQFGDQIQRLDDNEPDEGYWPQLDGREEELWGPLLFQARVAGEETERRALAVALNFSRRKGQLTLEEDLNITLAVEMLEVLEEMTVESFTPGELQRPLATKDTWGEKLGDCKTDKARVCAIGAFLRNFRLPSRKRDREGTHYSRLETIEVIGSHAPPTDMHMPQKQTICGLRV